MRVDDVRDVKKCMTALAQRIRELETKPVTVEIDHKGYKGDLKTAAVRRASMDLTRALSRLRNPTRRKRP